MARAILKIDMTVKIDKAGRVILPKLIRERLGVRAGTDLEIEETPEGVMLKSASHRPSLVRKGSFLVYDGEIPQGNDMLTAVDDDRAEQMRRAWGL